MKSAVELEWHGTDPGTKPMHIESGELLYKERDAKVFLSPWSKLSAIPWLSMRVRPKSRSTRA